MGKEELLSGFNKYKFDDDEEWKTYLKNVEITSNDPAAVLKLKGRWYKKNKQPDFDVAWLADAKKPENASSTSRTAAPEQPSAARSTPPPTYTSSTGTAGAQGGRDQHPLFMLRSGLVLISCIHAASLLPFIRHPVLQSMTYRWFTQVLLISSVYAITLKHGYPQLKPFAWSNLKQYLARIGNTSDFHFMTLGFLLSLHQRPISLMVPCAAIPALYEALAYMSANMRDSTVWRMAGSKLHAALLPKQQAAQMLSVLCELATGAWLIIFGVILGQNRNILLTVAYWQLLKMRYHVSDVAGLHRQAWYLIGQKTAAIQNLPVISIVIRLAQRWFTSPR